MSETTRQYKTGTVKITVDYGYDIHSIEFSGRTYNRIASGKEVTIRGQGFYWDESLEQDYWQFNVSKQGVNEQGALYVYTADGGEVFIGNLNDGEVVVDRC